MNTEFTTRDRRGSGGPSGLASPARLTAALDFPEASQAIAMADKLAPLGLWVKLGLELFTAEGPALVRTIRDKNLPVFLDLKFHDIPNTVKGAVRSVTLLGAEMCTVHSSGGEDMCRAAVLGRQEGLELQEQKGLAACRGPLLMAVTVLTSQGGDAKEIAAQVVDRALMAQRSGLDGVVCSGREASAVKAACGKDFLCLCPGIRFAGADGDDDQARVCTPAQAVAAGADFLVMGRPITRADDPVMAARRALAEMEK